MKPTRLTIPLLSAFAALLAVVTYGPVLVTVITAFVPIKAGVFQWGSPSLYAFQALARDSELLHSLMLTVMVGFIASTLAIAISTTAALFCATSKGPLRLLLEFLIFLPFVMPPMITGLALLIFFRDVSVTRSLVTVVTGHTILLLAVAYRTVSTRLKELSASLFEASRDLGASDWQTFRLVTFPLLLPAMLTSFVLCFALSFDETLVTLLLTGGDTTFPVRLWGMMRLGFSPSVSAVVVFVLGASILFSVVAVRFLGAAPRSTGGAH